MRTLRQDVQFGLRLLAKRPAFSSFLILILAVGIGATTAIFSVVDAVVLRPLPYRDPGRLYQLGGADRDGSRWLSAADFTAWRKQTRAFALMAASRTDNFIVLSGADRPEHLLGQRVTREYFPLFGMKPLLGRWFALDEYRPGAPHNVIIGEVLWRRQFAATSRIIGRSITLNGEPHTVIGVMPAAFRAGGPVREVWRTYEFTPEDLACADCVTFSTVARLRADATSRDVEREAAFFTQSFTHRAPKEHEGWRATVEPLTDEATASSRASVLVLFGAVTFVLMIACMKIANLLLVRAGERRGEMAVRLALGAGRARILRQLLTESLVIAACGGAGGIVLAHGGVRLLTAAPVLRWVPVIIDARVLGFTTAAALLCGVLFGVAPAFSASSVNVNESLKESSRGGSSSRGRRRLRNLLIVLETALSVILLAGAILMLRSFARLTSVDPGFREDGILTARVPVPVHRAPDKAQQVAYYRGLLDRVQSMPGVRSAALASAPPLGQWMFSVSFNCQCSPEVADRHRTVPFRAVSGDFFRTLGIRILRGRGFTERDMAQGAPKVAVINEALARELWPHADPVGRMITTERGEDKPEWIPVVGVAASIHGSDLAQKPASELYIPYSVLLGLPHASLIMRTAGAPAAFAPEFRSVMREWYPEQPVEDLSSMRQLREGKLAVPRLYTALLGGFAAFGLLLAGAGMFAMTACTVTEREHELGIRMAVGARLADVLRLVMAESSKSLVAGLAIGVPAAFAAVKLLASELYGVTSSDPVTFAIVPLVLCAAVLSACALSARRAARIDPAIALRAE